MTSLTSEQKATKRTEVALRRSKNALAVTLMPIAWKQAHRLSSSSGVDKDETLAQAMLGVAEALRKGEVERPGFYKRTKQYAVGYVLNFYRDKSRNVRVPRNLTLAYLAEQRMLRTDPEFCELSTADKAAQLGLTIGTLLEARQAMSMFSVSLDKHDACANLDSTEHSRQLTIASTIVLDVVEAGVKALAGQSKSKPAVLKEAFYNALKIVLEAQSHV